MRFQKIGYLLIVILLMTACEGGEQKDLAAKKKKLTEYKTQLKDITSKIEVLEKEIAAMDTSFTIERKAKLVQVSALQKEDFKHYIEVQGSVDAAEDIIALCQQPGIVTAIYVTEGDRVTKGQLLAITETTTAMKNAIQILQTQLDLATTAYEKQKRLWEQNIGSEIQYLQAKTQKEALEKQMQAQETQLEMTKIKAPINGVVDEVRLKIGDMAAPSQLMPGIRIINSDKLSVKAKLADSDFGKVRKDDKVEIEFPDINKSITATVSYVSKTIDSRSRTFTVEAKLNNGTSNYAANMIAKMKINDATVKNALTVPTNVIQKSLDGLYVLVAAEKDGVKIAQKHMVKTGLEYNGETVITEGLSEGDQIITFGFSEVVDGQRIAF